MGCTKVEKLLAEVKTEANKIDILETVTDESFQTAAKSYPDKKVKGIDAWSTRFLATIPHHLRQGFVSLLNSVQLQMFWPIQMLLNLMSLIPKPQGGQRPIAKTPMLYRIWSIIRATIVKHWAEDTVDDFDYAVAKRSALYSGAVRSWASEVAHFAGMHAGALLWDLDKFFDSIDPAQVLKQGLAFQYPPLDLALAIAMHVAPRCMVLNGTLSHAIRPATSILAGCMHSGNFAKLVMKQPIGDIVRRVNDAKTYTYVDDVAQQSIGSFLRVANALIHAGILFVSKMRAINLTISPAKSAIVTSNDRLAMLVSKAIAKQTGLKLMVQGATKDLGVQHTAAARRNTLLQRQRLRKATIRCQKISKLARNVRKAGKLAQTGALPQATWGVGALGMSPTTLKQFRSAMAAASGIVAEGRCPATAIAIVMGPRVDPAIQIPMLQCSLWIDLWRGDASLRALAARHWADSYNSIRGLGPGVQADRATMVAEACYKPQLFSSRAKWSKVFGPMTSTMATLYDAGWDLSSRAKWVDPDGRGWIPDFNACKEPFLQLIGDFAERLVWERASESWCGKGLHSGVDWIATLSLYNHIAVVNGRSDSSDELVASDEPGLFDQLNNWPENAATWLELFLTGGYWPQERLSQIHGHVASVCPRCSLAPESPFHLMWDCPANAEIRDSRVKGTQELISQAKQGFEDYPCLWLRGMLPKGLVALNTPYVEEDEISYISHVPSSPWPDGTYHTDASGGEHSAIPAIRRCGLGIAYVAQDDASFSGPISESLLLWGAYLPLPGKAQTIVRAELYAILTVVKNAAREVTIVSDSKVNVDSYNAGREACIKAANSDLWIALWTVVCEKEMTLSLIWSKGHADQVDVYERYNVTPRNLFGNLCADRLAARAADECQVGIQDSTNLKWHYSIVNRVQARAITILSTVLQRESTLTKPHVGPKFRRISQIGRAMASAHDVTIMAKALHCYKCLMSSSPDATSRARFLASPCKPDNAMLQKMTLGDTKPTTLPKGKQVKVGMSSLHTTHALCCYRGLLFCGDCGYYASSKAQQLLKPCEDRGAKATMRVNQLRQGKLPSGLKSWPNDTATREDMVVLLDDSV